MTDPILTNSCNLSEEKVKKADDEIKVWDCSFKALNQTEPVHLETICCNLSKEEMTRAFYLMLKTL